MTFWRTGGLILCMAIPVAQTAAQDENAAAIVTPKTVDQVRALTLELWPSFRETSQPFYAYVRMTTDFRAYARNCKRHDLNVQMEPVNQLAIKYLKAIITAFYEDPELAIFDGLTNEQEDAILNDFANDVLALDYGLSLADMDQRIKAAGGTTKAYCDSMMRDYAGRYISLRATAKRQLEDAN